MHKFDETVLLPFDTERPLSDSSILCLGQCHPCGSSVFSLERASCGRFWLLEAAKPGTNLILPWAVFVLFFWKVLPRSDGHKLMKLVFLVFWK